MDRIETLKKECRVKFNKIMATLPEEFQSAYLVFGNRRSYLGCYRGNGFLKDFVIEISIPYLDEHPNYVINKTIPHEIAHHITYIKNGYRNINHGIEWKREFSKLAGIPVSKIRAKSDGVSLSGKYMEKDHVAYVCSCRTHYLTKKEDAEISIGKYSCGCSNCGDTLKRK